MGLFERYLSLWVSLAIAADQTAFALAVTVPESAAPGEVPNLSVRVQHANGATISKPVAVKLIVE